MPGPGLFARFVVPINIPQSFPVLQEGYFGWYFCVWDTVDVLFSISFGNDGIRLIETVVWGVRSLSLAIGLVTVKDPRLMSFSLSPNHMDLDLADCLPS